MPEDTTIEAAVSAVAEHLRHAFDLPAWEATRPEGGEEERSYGPMLVNDRYVGRDGSTPADFRREATAAFATAGIELAAPAGAGEGGWLEAVGRLDGATITVRSEGGPRSSWADRAGPVQGTTAGCTGFEVSGSSVIVTFSKRSRYSDSVNTSCPGLNTSSSLS